MKDLIFLINVLLVIFSNNQIIKNSLCDYWEYKLIRDLLSDYDPSIRPSNHHNDTLNVTFGLALAQIIDVVIVPFLKIQLSKSESFRMKKT